jgi:hypothetical protein
MIRLLTLIALSAAALAGPAAADVISLTQSKAVAGNVTPGDTAGFPITISQPGSYRLDTNLTPGANKAGIEIKAPNVSIDLNGFALDGASVATVGIYGNAASISAAIRDGTITRFKSDGINGNAGWEVERVRVVANGRYGIKVGNFFVLTNNIVRGNTSSGIYTNVSGVIQGNTVAENGATGISTYRAAIVGNAINNNISFGIDGGTTSAYGNNMLFGNNSSGAQVKDVTPLQPNVCLPSC